MQQLLKHKQNINPLIILPVQIEYFRSHMVPIYELEFF